MQILEESQIFKSPLNSKSIFNGRLLIIDQPAYGGVRQAARDEILLGHLASAANIQFVE